MGKLCFLVQFLFHARKRLILLHSKFLQRKLLCCNLFYKFSIISHEILEGVQKPRSDKTHTHTLESEHHSSVPYLVISETVLLLGLT